ncbi:hypothetical protein BH23ACT10_BH23ACT10_35110 [soil metagenome]
MIIASAVFGVLLALLAMAGSPALPYVAVAGGAAIGLGWAFYVNRE